MANQTSYQVWEGVYKSETPIIQSHEPVGTIVAMGPKAEKAGKWKVGQRVGYLLFRHQCHTCAACKNYDEIRFCQKADHAGLDADGGMGEYSIGDADNAVLLPDEVPFEQAAPLMCAGVGHCVFWVTQLTIAGNHLGRSRAAGTSARIVCRNSRDRRTWRSGGPVRQGNGIQGRRYRQS
jgi:threonine dehydrogenase-like Zn-dependent dehydrogenase